MSLLLDLNTSFLLRGKKEKKSKMVSGFSSECGQLKVHAVHPVLQLGQICKAKQAGSLCIGIASMLARLTVASMASVLVSLLKQALKGFRRVQLSAADSVCVRHVQVFHAAMNIGCYKITSSSFVIQRASATIYF